MLAQGTTTAGKPFWAGSATKGFTYKDPKGEHVFSCGPMFQQLCIVVITMCEP